MKQNDFDRLISGLDGLNDVTKTRPRTVRTISPMIGGSQTFIIQTFRQRDIGDYIFLEGMSEDGAIRIVLPPQVADAIAAQRDSVTAKVRSKASRQVAQDRKDRGEVPFIRKAQ